MKKEISELTKILDSLTIWYRDNQSVEINDKLKERIENLLTKFRDRKVFIQSVSIGKTEKNPLNSFNECEKGLTEGLSISDFREYNVLKSHQLRGNIPTSIKDNYLVIKKSSNLILLIVKNSSGFDIYFERVRLGGKVFFWKKIISCQSIMKTKKELDKIIKDKKYGIDKAFVFSDFDGLKNKITDKSTSFGEKKPYPAFNPKEFKLSKYEGFLECLECGKRLPRLNACTHKENCPGKPNNMTYTQGGKTYKLNPIIAEAMRNNEIFFKSNNQHPLNNLKRNSLNSFLDIKTPEKEKRRLDGSTEKQVYRREGGKFGSHPSHDDYNEESIP